jgi:hypothetical protein
VAETFDDFCRACIDLFKAKHTRYLIIGGVAVAAVGTPRFTGDLDAIVFVDRTGLADLITYALHHGFRGDLDEELRAADSGTSVRLSRGKFHLDLVLRSLPMEDRALARARTVKVFRRGVVLPRPEDLIVLKLVAGRPLDLADAEGIVKRHAARLDRKYVERSLAELCELAEDHAYLERWRAVLGTATPRSRGSRRKR